ncbi:hypothetical protein BGX20_010594 [Mortierella sp. AD010]|nr:hypothetical protein BGX20_010594 [Mortierella sp. AD010]
MDPEPRLPFSSCPISSPSDPNPLQMANPVPSSGNGGWQPLLHSNPVINFQPQPVTANPQARGEGRKRAMLVSRIRKVFNKPIISSPAKEQQEKEGMQRQSLENIALSPCLSSEFMLDQHRDSVSSSSSGESMSVGQAEFGLNTPLTSPEISPSGSPKLKHILPESQTQSFATGIEPQATMNSLNTADTKPLEKRLSLEPTQTRTLKKRLSFASITSFFNPRGSDAAAAEANRKKQQRSSSVPNIENPLVTVGRQIAGFQRRHSLNGMPECPTPNADKQFAPPSLPQQNMVAPPWDKDRTSAQAAALAAEMLEISTSKTSSEKIGDSIKKSRIYGVFGKQSKKKNKKKGDNGASIVAADNTATAGDHAPRRQRSSSLSKAPSNQTCIYEQTEQQQQQLEQPQPQPEEQQQVSSVRRASLPRPLVSFPQDPTPGSRRASEEQQLGRLGERQGHYSVIDRKQRLSVRYPAESERDNMQYQESPTTAPCQVGGFMVQHPIECGLTGPLPRPRITPVSTALPSPTQDQSYGHIPLLSPTSPQRNSFCSIAGAESGQFSSDAYSFAVSMQESPMTAYRRNSYHQGENLGNRNSIVLVNAPVSRLSMDPSLYMESSGPEIVAPIPMSVALPFSPMPTIPAMVNANLQHQQHQQYLQQQQQLQMHAQHQQFQQFQRAQQQQQQFLQQQQYQQQFMNPLALASPSQTPSVQDSFHLQHHPYPHPHPYQFNMHQQPIPSHLYYPSPQHPLQYHAQQQFMTNMTNANNVQYGPMTTTSTLSPTENSTDPTASLSSCGKPASPSKQIQFSTAQPIVHQTWAADQYDRTSDPNITAHRLTQAIAQKIKLELNQFKSQEMIVHQDSRAHTHFFA